MIGLLLNPFGIYASTMALQEGRIVCKRPETIVPLGTLTSAPTVKRTLFGATLTIRGEDGCTYRLKGARYDTAKSFSTAVKNAWTDYHTRLLQAEWANLETLLSAIRALAVPVEYPAACTLSPMLERARMLNQRLLSKLPEEAIEPDIRESITMIQSFIQNASKMRQEAVAKFEDHQLSAWSRLFDTFESHPLTREQRRAIVTDEDATLVLAGAGSGKTSVITAKAGYLLQSGTRKPNEILILAFARDAAREMSRRLQEKCCEHLEASTFHALAYNIIGTVEGCKPALAAHATDEKAFLYLIKTILRDQVHSGNAVSKSIIRWFSYARAEQKDAWDFKTKHDYYQFIEKSDLRTLQGELVKSFEELMIANWLFENGIAYEYEPVYEHSVSESGYKKYCPDFRLIRSGIYIEHFGVRRRMKSDGTMELTTAPFVDRTTYLKQMEWKRRVHNQQGTTLVQTYSYERQEGRLLEALAEKTAPYEEQEPRAPETLFDRIVELNQADSFTQLLGTFLRHYKGGGYVIRDCREKANRLKFGIRAKEFLAIFEVVHMEYQRRLNGRIDFDDMMTRAADYIERGDYVSPFKHILVDEFQDLSRGRARLIKALKAQHSDARLFAVGDDWQSIYHFAGSDVNLMRCFGREFGGAFDNEIDVHRVVDLGRTFRSVDEIAQIARRFILKNPAQLDKTIIPVGTAETPALKVVSVVQQDVDQTLAEILRSLSVDWNDGNRTTVLLLGRYRHCAPDQLSQFRRQCPHLDITYKTIHASKGLEADHVILLNLFRGRSGFPSETVDDPLLSLVSPDTESFENAEERRVLYVALTRARRTVTLISLKSRPSAFVTELLNDPGYGLVQEGDNQLDHHTCGECGGDLSAFRARDGQMWYRCEHTRLCGNALPACQVCGVGRPAILNRSTVKKCTRCGTGYPVCPVCTDGWLVERKSRFGLFLGCVRFPQCSGKMKQSRGRGRPQ